ncbi:GNAT family N-acetyltransferase [Oscillatoria sp. FACHB-1406]|uniref:GNAT family N-acetyltransferase n=1 Tax=Oscillatoria sp. FACHB-1406 TaxID=2692846 RepID=UPI0016834B49|nr:GNAT family N-acetyltransferase [Oscillatoria sp. FACHB-1406]MBD2579126.1 GNAT family N-acetyltransferase [Oscillatoria sp. FACHB-1406]
MLVRQQFRSRSHQGEADLEAIAKLINACKAADTVNNGTSVEKLRRKLEDPMRRESQLWEDDSGQLLGYAEILIVDREQPEGYLSFCVCPECGKRELEREILAWAEAQLQQRYPDCPGAITLRVNALSDRAQRLALFAECGFAPERYFFRMRRSLSEPIPEPQFPAGFALIPANPETDAIAWLELYNQSFIDHWNHHDMTLEQLQYYLNEPSYNRDLDLIAAAPDGTFAAFCYCKIKAEANERNGRKEGWICTLGTRRGFRKQGLGRAMLLSGLQCLQAAGAETAVLGVDADNPNGALKLYESVGFQRFLTNVVCVKKL